MTCSNNLGVEGIWEREQTRALDLNNMGLDRQTLSNVYFVVLHHR